MKKNKKRYVLITLAVLMIFGGVLRVLCCFWGYPHQLHPDENTIVNNAIDMLSRNSWEAYVYNRPDQFEIKCNALIFEVVSRLRWHLPAEEVFAYSQGPFYLLARFYTAMFGIAMIPMTYLLTGKIFRNGKLKHVEETQLLAAALIAVSPIFIQNSAYATPDIVLSFFVLLIGYLSLFYLEGKGTAYMYWIAAVTGICISIKYPAAIMCLYIAFLVIYQCVKEKLGWKPIFVQGFICIVLVFGTVFVIAPNLFTDISSAVEVFLTEARPNHVGADGLNLLGNMYYYIYTIMEHTGLFSLIFFLIGVWYLIKNRSEKHFPLLLSGIYWICLSVLSLHWLRWGLPMYLSYLILAAAGCVWILEQIGALKKGKKAALVGGAGAAVIMLCNTLLFGLVITKWSCLPDARVLSMDFCEEQNITEENSIFEGYTPLKTGYWGGPQTDEFEMKEGELQLKEDSEKQYYVMSSNFRSRYQKNERVYSKELEFYRKLQEKYHLIYELKGSFYQKSPYEIQNLGYSIDFLFKEHKATGDTIYIYELKSK